jgi:stage V sporulation protein AC
MVLIISAQFITGLGIYDDLVKFAGAGLIVPITGFANAIVSPAMEYKKEGIVLGTGAKLFSLAGPVLVCGYSSSVIIGIIYAVIT